MVSCSYQAIDSQLLKISYFPLEYCLKCFQGKLQTVLTNVGFYCFVCLFSLLFSMKLAYLGSQKHFHEIVTFFLCALSINWQHRVLTVWKNSSPKLIQKCTNKFILISLMLALECKQSRKKNHSQYNEVSENEFTLIVCTRLYV